MSQFIKGYITIHIDSDLNPLGILVAKHPTQKEKLSMNPLQLTTNRVDRIGGDLGNPHIYMGKADYILTDCFHQQNLITITKRW